MKHPAAATAVLALHLLGLLALLAARPPARAPSHDSAQRTAPAAVLHVNLRVSLPNEASPPAQRAVAPLRPAPSQAAATVTAPAVMPLPAETPAPAPITDVAAATLPTAAPAPAHKLATALEAPTPPAPATATTAAANTPEPTMTLAQADHRDCPAATHPAALRERGIEGEVRLLVRVGTDGRAAEVRLQQPSGWRLFDHAALAQAQACRFVPARRGVQAVESWVEFPVRFSLRG